MTLYEEYGRAMVDLEIIQGRVNQLKQRIIEDMQKPKEEPTPEVEPVSKPEEVK